MDSTVTRLKEVLSYTEISAAEAILDELEGKNEKVIAPTKIASKKSISKSVVVSVLRFLRVTGVVETKRIGGQGIRVTVLNREVLEAVAKF